MYGDSPFIHLAGGHEGRRVPHKNEKLPFSYMATYSIETATTLIPRLNVPKYITVTGRSANPDLLNSIKATMLTHVPCFGFDNMIDPQDFPFIKNVLKLDFDHEHYTVLTNTTRYATPILAQRLGRLAVYTSAETLAVLTGSDDVMIVFLLCDEQDPSKPLKNMDPIDIVVSSRSLVPRVYKKEGTEWRFDQGHTDRIQALKETIFHYDTDICTLAYGQELHAIVKPIYSIGLKDPRWQPCTWRFRHERDPLWNQEEGYANIQLLKKPGKMGLKEQFTTMSPTACRAAGLPLGSTYDNKLFGVPYGVQMMFVFNGKMDPKLAFMMSIEVLTDAMSKFGAQYRVAATTLDEPSIIYKEQRDTSTQTLYVPYNTNDTMPDEFMILTKHVTGNIIVNKMLYIFNRDIVKNNKELYKNTLIAYKIPHQLVTQCTYTIQLPLSEDICLKRFADIGITDEFHENLIAKALDELKTDLGGLAVLS